MALEKLSGHYDEPVKTASNRGVGLLFALAFAVIAALPLLSGRPARGWLFVVSVVFAALAWLAPDWLSPLNRAWTRFGLILHRVMSPLVLGIVFVFTIVPIGLLLRLLGKDPLRLKFEPERSTYWIERRPNGPEPNTLKRQF